LIPCDTYLCREINLFPLLVRSHSTRSFRWVGIVEHLFGDDLNLDLTSGRKASGKVTTSPGG
jgi:hypothetical protein